jgi:pyridoxine kinase
MRQAHTILSVQSFVSYGHVGNSAAMLPLQRLGFEVWPVPTLLFSNHPGYGRPRGRVLEPELVAALIDGVAERGAFGDCAALLSGYLGDAANGPTLLAAAQRLKSINPTALWCCDPVMGDVEDGIYVRPGIPEFFRECALPHADMLTPNQFELEQLVGRRLPTLAEVLAAATALCASGPRMLLVTSLSAGGPDTIEMLAVSSEEAWLVSTPRLPLASNGTGDAVAALFLGNYLRTQNIAEALDNAAASIFGVIAATSAAGAQELLLVAAQDELAAPTRRFPPQKLR